MTSLTEDSALENSEGEANSEGCLTKKMKLILAIAIPATIIVLIVIIVSVVVIQKKKSKELKVYQFPYKTITEAFVNYEVLGTTERKKATPGVHNEGHSNVGYPTYGSNFNAVLGPGKEQLRNDLIYESSYLAAHGTKSVNSGGMDNSSYTWMNADGELFQGTISSPIPSINKFNQKARNNQRKLYKHNASIGLYFGDVSDDEPSIIKRLTLSNRGYNSYSVTGLYAPAGEVIKVEIPEDVMDAANSITFHIGQALYNGQANNIWGSKNQMPRFPHLLNTMTLSKNTAFFDNATKIYTGYIGSFIGGPIYVRNSNVQLKLTIYGGVNYPHFILGITTPEMYKELLKSSAPFFDMEVWNYGVLHSGPRRYSDSFSYEDLYKAATLWDKVSCVTTYNNKQGIVFLYDPFVAAGAAVAFPGRSSVNCPAGWMSNSLNYKSVVSSGAWGNFHEYHHNFQGYGVGNGGEVTNNGLSLVSYALFTKISSNRGIESYATQGIGGWNRYTSSVFALSEVLKIKYENENPSNGKQGLSLYACLLHNFGPDAYIKVKGAGGGQTYKNYMDKWQMETHNNMYYYFNELLGGTGISNTANESYSIFVPVSCAYQTGRSYLYYNTETNKYEKRYIKTMRPYIIPFGVPFDIDLTIYNISDNIYQSGSILLPTKPDKSERFTHKIKSFTQPKRGKIDKIDDFHYRFTPDYKSDNLTSDEIIVTLEIKDKLNQLKVDDVDLILEFEMSHETLKSVLERTIYTYDPSKMYSDATVAYDNGFKGYKEVLKVDHSNPTQNCNTDIWHHANTSQSHKDNPDSPDYFFIQNNMIEVLEGKLYFSESKKYRIYLRGRENVALYYSLNGNDYRLGATIKEKYDKSYEFKLDKNNTYFDIEFLMDGTVYVTNYQYKEEVNEVYKLTADKNGDIRNFIYVKEVVIDNITAASFIGLGCKEWAIAQFSMDIEYFDENDNKVESDDPNVSYTWTKWLNSDGAVVARVKEYLKQSKDTEYYKVEGGTETKIDENEFSSITKEQITPPTKEIAYANAYRKSYEFINNVFETDYFYTRTFNIQYSGDPEFPSTWDEGASIINTSYVPAKQNPNNTIDNLFTYGTDTYIYPEARTDSSTYYNIDMGREINAKSITFHGRTPNEANRDNQGFPKTFAIYISNDNINYVKAGDYSINSCDYGNNDERAITANFGKVISFRYINITVGESHSHDGRIILSGIKFNSIFELKDVDNSIVIGGDKVTTVGSWNNVITYSRFGTVYVGQKKSKIKFEFTGTRLGIESSTKFGANYVVNIDGNKVNSIKLKKLTSEYGITYISQKLENKKHSVEIVCNGEANFGCFSYHIDPKYFTA